MSRFAARIHAKNLTISFIVCALALCSCTDSSAIEPRNKPNGKPTLENGQSYVTEHPESLKNIVANLPLDFHIWSYGEKPILGKTTLKLSELMANDKPLVLNFWAAFCPPCRTEMPDIQTFYDNFADEVTVISIDVGSYNGLGTQADAQRFLDEMNFTYPIGFIEDSTVIQDYEIFNMPTTVFIMPNGEIFRKWGGLLNLEILTDVYNEMQVSSSYYKKLKTNN